MRRITDKALQHRPIIVAAITIIIFMWWIA